MADTSASAYRVLARKYRPQSFVDLVGQEPMVRTLTNAFATGRIAQAYLLTGVRGVGKTTTARILARALNYALPGRVDRPSIDLTEPGEHCAAIMAGNHVDVIEMDAASHTGIGDIREIIEAVRYRPALARYKVYIIDEVHMLSNQAFNGLLKTLEEPPEHVKFIFATTEVRKIPVTVLSRTQRFDLRRIDGERLVALLRGIAEKEGVAIDDAALALIARAAEGSARDSLSLLDQAIASRAPDGAAGFAAIAAADIAGMLGLADRGRAIDLFEQAMRGDARAALATFAELYNAGADPAVVLLDLAAFTHLVTRIKIAPEAAADPALTEEERTRGAAFAAALSLGSLSRAWQLLLKGIDEVKESPRPAAATDMVLVRLAYASELPTPDEAIRLLRDAGAGRTLPASNAAPSSSRDSSPAGYAGASVGAAPVRPNAGWTGRAAPARPEAAAVAAFRGDGAAAVARDATPPLRAEVLGAMPISSPPPEADNDGGPRLESIEDLVALAGRHRDLPVKIGLERHVRLVRIEPGRLDIALTEDASAGLVGDLTRRLQEWTGRRWVVSVVQGPAPATLGERRAESEARLKDDARSHPLVAAVMARFPGAEIVDVRVRAEEPPPFAEFPPGYDGDDRDSED